MVVVFHFISLVAAIKKEQQTRKSKVMAAMESMGTSIHCHQHSKELAVAKGMDVSHRFDGIHDKP